MGRPNYKIRVVRHRETYSIALLPYMGGAYNIHAYVGHMDDSKLRMMFIEEILKAEIERSDFMKDSDELCGKNSKEKRKKKKPRKKVRR